ncbi:hypothetical protein ASPFODRAFT_54748 [Aspergillus luchuensis CBS 106.47]|uniref:Uncharacterized protein n=1 Tax=Aspergillus luchuensis (strain CBS 106.47) TaxID=1137211 RepID=A0A1M3SYY8_ASPLC|nr:hypothetical protein ASPFODRAFT_54748 [Aspergillus luchuensis CBS 106.47]
MFFNKYPSKSLGISYKICEDISKAPNIFLYSPYWRHGEAAKTVQQQATAPRIPTLPTSPGVTKGTIGVKR